MSGTLFIGDVHGCAAPLESMLRLVRPRRVVLLGDSFVFGNSVRAEDRFGVLLEKELSARSRSTTETGIEVLHIGIGSWNTRAQCSFLRRQLSDYDPDLVVQVFIGNDLDDNYGVRGFGTLADFDPKSARQREPGKRNDIADLHSEIALLNEMRDRFSSLAVRRAWKEANQRDEIIAATSQLQEHLRSIAGADLYAGDQGRAGRT